MKHLLPNQKYKPVKRGEWKTWAIQSVSQKRLGWITVTDAKTEHEANIEALKKEGHDLQRRLDEIQNKLEDLGVVDPDDPKGWLS